MRMEPVGDNKYNIFYFVRENYGFWHITTNLS